MENRTNTDAIAALSDQMLKLGAEIENLKKNRPTQSLS
jgi:hypothetical protein